MSRPCSDNFKGSAVWYLPAGSSTPLPLTKGVTLPDDAAVLALPYRPEQEPPPVELFSSLLPQGAHRFEVRTVVKSSERVTTLRLSHATDWDLPPMEETAYERAPAAALLGILRSRLASTTQDTANRRAAARRAELDATLSRGLPHSALRSELREHAYQAYLLSSDSGGMDEIAAGVPHVELSPEADLHLYACAQLIALDDNLPLARVLASYSLPSLQRQPLEEIVARQPLIAPGPLFAVLATHYSYDDSNLSYAGEGIESVWPTQEQAQERASLIALNDRLMSSVLSYHGEVHASAVALQPTADMGEIRRGMGLDLPVVVADQPREAPVSWENGCAWVVFTTEPNDDDGPSSVPVLRSVHATRAAAEAAAAAAPLLDVERLYADGDQVYVSNAMVRISACTPVSGLLAGEVGEHTSLIPRATAAASSSATVLAYPVQ